jgi:carbohydrate kinase (thermoresistant glucokinase family)
MLILVMGVAGSGKSTVGSTLAAALGWEFADADEYHSPANVAKMAAGVPLTDEDRVPWLDALHTTLRQRESNGRHVVLACSALRASYRNRICAASSQPTIVYLKAARSLVFERMSRRPGHFMPVSLIDSQFAALEEPHDALVFAADGRLDDIVSAVRAHLSS